MLNSLSSRIPFLALLLAVFSFGATAQVVVIQLGSDGTPLHNVITVAKKNGDFTDPVAAIQSITDADETNRYLLYIGPGVYTLTARLDMQEYVDIVGSGRNATQLTGALGGSENHYSSALILGADNASLRSLSIENTGSGDSYCFGVYNELSSPTMSNLTITASGGCSFNYGVRNLSSSPTMSDMTITVSGGGNANFGVSNSTSSSPTMSDLTITASGSGVSLNYGVSNGSSSSPTMSDMTITASGGTDSYGIKYFSSSDVFALIRGSTISASGASSLNTSIAADSGTGANETYIIDSLVFGPVSGNPVCYSVRILGIGLPLNEDCTPPL